MMKQVLVVLALVGVAFSAPQPRKLFHEHMEDFQNIIVEDAMHDIEHLMEHYLEFEEFLQALDYLRTNSFRDLVYEMESLPEFNAVVEFLESINIDIHYFIDFFNEMIDNFGKKRIEARHELSGRDLTAFIKDAISEFPKAKLAALFDEKMAEDEEFRFAIESLYSDEWDAVFQALWNNDVFHAEVHTLADHGIDLHVVIDQIVAIFGQN